MTVPVIAPSERRLADLEAAFGERVVAHQQARDLAEFARYQSDAVAFARERLRVRVLPPAEEQMLRLVAAHPRVAIVGGQGTSKTHGAAITLLWWLLANGPSQVVTLCPTDKQNRILWGTVRALYLQADPPLPGVLFAQGLLIDEATRHFAQGMVATGAGTLTGSHHAKLLVLCDESHSLEEFSWQGVHAMAVGQQNRIAAFGNPTSPSGPWYRMHRSDLYARLSVSCLEHPNIVEAREVVPGGPSLAWLETMRQTFGEGSPTWQQRVLGRFVDADEQGLVSREVMERAALRWQRGDFEPTTQGARHIVGVDIARLGQAKTVAVVTQGWVVRRIESWGKCDLMATAARLGLLLDQLGLGPRTRERISPAKWSGLGPEPIAVIDAAGLGGGVADRLRELGYLRVQDFNGGTRASKSERFVNRRCEAFWGLREALVADRLAVPWSDLVVDELTSMRWKVNPQSKIELEPKSELTARIGRSPDSSDALCMALAHLTTPQYTAGGFSMAL